jgi:hypothetical protein
MKILNLRGAHLCSVVNRGPYYGLQNEAKRGFSRRAVEKSQLRPARCEKSLDSTSHGIICPRMCGFPRSERDYDNGLTWP